MQQIFDENNICEVFSKSDINEQVEILNKNITSALKSVRRYRRKSKRTDDSWMTSSEVTFHRSMRDLVFKLYLSDRNESNWKT